MWWYSLRRRLPGRLDRSAMQLSYLSVCSMQILNGLPREVKGLPLMSLCLCPCQVRHGPNPNRSCRPGRAPSFPCCLHRRIAFSMIHGSPAWKRRQCPQQALVCANLSVGSIREHNQQVLSVRPSSIFHLPNPSPISELISYLRTSSGVYL